MRHIEISDSTGGRYFWTEGYDVFEMSYGEVEDAITGLFADNAKFTITYTTSGNSFIHQ